MPDETVVVENRPAEQAPATEESPTDTPKPEAFAPDGFPDHLRGGSERETLENVWKAYKGLRDKPKEERGKDTPKPEAKPESKAPKAWTEYLTDLPEAKEGERYPLNADDTVLQEFAKAAKAADIPKAAALKLLQGFMSSETLAEIIPPPVDEQAETKILVEAFGSKEGAESRLEAMKAWGEQRLADGFFNEEEHKEFQIAAGTARGLVMMQKLVSATLQRSVPLTPATGGDPVSLEVVHARMADPKYDTDPEFRQETLRMLHKAEGAKKA